MKKKKIIAYGVFILVLAILRLIIALFESKDSKTNNEGNSFRELTASLLSDELSSNALNLHYSFALPENFLSDIGTITLRPYSENSYLESITSLSYYRDTLSAYDLTSLSENDSRTQKLLLSYLNKELELLKYPYFEEPLSPHSGIHSELPILLSEYTFRTKQDVDNYLEIIKCIPAYFNGFVLFEQQKAAAGLFMSKSAAESIISQCEMLFTNEELLKQTHFLQTTFEERLRNLVQRGEITTIEADHYMEVNNTSIKNYLVPSYHTLADAIYLLLDQTSGEYGLFYDKYGTEYYTLLLHSQTGSSKTPEELFEILSEQLSKNNDELNRVILAITEKNMLSILTDKPTLSISTPNEMIIDLMERMNTSFPIAYTDISFEIKEVQESLSQYSAPAFYLTPPIDDLRSNTIYMNSSSEIDDLTYYTTLAHEGFPGHLYQTVYHGLYDIRMDEDPVQCLLYYGGYTEGWATYVEDIAYEYAKELVSDPLVASLYQANRNLQLCLFSFLDICIHYYGKTPEEVAEILKVFGITDANTVRKIFNYIVEEPCNYLKYYIGFLEIVECKEEAKSVWGEKYSDLNFHTFLLNIGPADFQTIKEYIKKPESFFK